MSNNMNDIVAKALAARTKEAIKDIESGGGFSKIETSGVYELKITMAKQVDSKSSDAKNFKVELEDENGAKVYWESGWYLNKDGSPLDKEGNLSIAAQKLISFIYTVTGKEELPDLTEATIKETVWTDGKPSEESAKRMIDKSLIGGYLFMQVARMKVNKETHTEEADGTWTTTKTNEARQYNDCRRAFNIDTKLSYTEALTDAEPTAFDKSVEWCENNPVVDKFAAVADAPSNSAGRASTSPAAGGGRKFGANRG